MIQSKLAKIGSIYPVVFCPSNLGSSSFTGGIATGSGSSTEEERSRIMQATNAYEDMYGSSYYSFFLQGCKLVVLNSSLLSLVPEDFVHFWKLRTRKSKKKPKPRSRRRRKKKAVDSKKGEEATSEASDKNDGDISSDFEDLDLEDDEEDDKVTDASDEEMSDDSNVEKKILEPPEATTDPTQAAFNFSAYSEPELVAIEQFIWLEHELFSARFEARHLLVFSYHSWHNTAIQTDPVTSSEAFKYVMPEHLAEFFVPKFQNSNAQIIFTSNNESSKVANAVFKEKPSGMFEVRLQHLYTKPFVSGSTDEEQSSLETSGTIRMIKCMGTEVKTELYKLSTLPKYLIMPEDHYVEEDEQNSVDNSFSSSSFGTSDTDGEYSSS